MKYTVIVLLLAAIHAAPQARRDAGNANTKASANIKGQSQEDKATTLLTSTQGKNQEDAERSEIFTGLLVLVGFLTCGVIAWQSWETRESANAARASAEAVRNAERAWILVHKIAPGSKDVKADAIPAFGYYFRVFGKTPAKIVEAACRYRLVGTRKRGPQTEPDLPVPADYGQKIDLQDLPDMGSVLPPLRTFSMTAVFESPLLGWTGYNAIKAREKYLCCYGFIKYIDAFDPTKIRHTKFCYVYDARTDGVLRSNANGEPLRPDDFRVGGPPEYNDAD